MLVLAGLVVGRMNGAMVLALMSTNSYAVFLLSILPLYGPAPDRVPAHPESVKVNSIKPATALFRMLKFSGRRGRAVMDLITMILDRCN
ncbi:hypothetical protein D3C81_894540 [compost metagenome]